MEKVQPSLLILAAGMGSRYGGLKQLDSFGPNGETIIDYSIYDAIFAGFKKIVFVIRRSFAKEFKQRMNDRWMDKIEMEYVYQELDSLPENYIVPENRTKPWGTGHAVWVAKDIIKGPFGVINADDFYGRAAIQVLFQFLSRESSYAVIAYKLENTLSEHGAVNRGVCEVNEQGYLTHVIERKNILKNQDIHYLLNEKKFILAPDTLVSMNMWAFQYSYFNWAEQYFIEFLNQHLHSESKEFYIPELIQSLIDNDRIKVQVLLSDSKWFGVTYKEDKSEVTSSIEEMIRLGVYPK